MHGRLFIELDEENRVPLENKKSGNSHLRYIPPPDMLLNVSEPIQADRVIVLRSKNYRSYDDMYLDRR